MDQTEQCEKVREHLRHNLGAWRDKAIMELGLWYVTAQMLDDAADAAVQVLYEAVPSHLIERE